MSTNGRGRWPSPPALALGAALSVLAVLGWAYADAHGRLTDLRIEVATLRARLEHAPATAATGGAEGEDPSEPTDDGNEDDSFESFVTAPAGGEEQWDCDGTITADMIRTSIAVHGSATLDCYRDRLRDLPELRGTIIAYARVGPGGRPDRVRVVGTIEDRLVRACVANRVAQWGFPPPVRGECAVVRLPFALSPQGASNGR